MKSKERILSVLRGTTPDHTPLTTWCFGLRAPQGLEWSAFERKVRFWYSLRMEHLHTLPVPWRPEDEFSRVSAWQELGVDDIIDVSIPWGLHDEVTMTDAYREPAGAESGEYERTYDTPAGVLKHTVKKTTEDLSEGWVIQPESVRLFEDFNIPRAVEHAVSSPEDIDRVGYLYRAPGMAEKAWFDTRMRQIRPFAESAGVPVQAWSAFGMDAVVWLMGAANAVLFALDYPADFSRLLDIVTETDVARTELAASNDGIDIVVERGWYSATDFWSPSMFNELLFNRIKRLSAVAHRHGKVFGYVMTTGIAELGRRLLEAGVDLLYFYDPVQDTVSIDEIENLARDGLTVVGGTNALSLLPGNESRMEEEVKRALDILGPTNRFILHPVDALFPDTPEEGVYRLIELWKKYR